MTNFTDFGNLRLTDLAVTGTARQRLREEKKKRKKGKI
jgi:hypothetical protein